MAERVLVTGATGFVGARLVLRLRDDGYRVAALHRAGARPPPVAGVEWRAVSSIGPDTQWSTQLADVDAVVHLAALAHQVAGAGEGRWTEFEAVNVLGTRRLAQACEASQSVRRLVFVSSVKAVRSQSDLPLSETTPCEPDDDYGRSKFLAETAVQEVLRDSGTDWCIIRPPLVYGPGNRANMARLVRLLRTRLPLPLAAVSGRRSFIYVDNLTHAISRVIDAPMARRQTFFVSDGEAVYTRDLIRLLAECRGGSARLFYCPVSALRLLGVCGDAMARAAGRSFGLDSYSVDRLIGSLVVDDSRIRETLGWAPPVSFREGVHRMMAEGTSKPIS